MVVVVGSQKASVHSVGASRSAWSRPPCALLYRLSSWGCVTDDIMLYVAIKAATSQSSIAGACAHRPVRLYLAPRCGGRDAC